MSQNFTFLTCGILGKYFTAYNNMGSSLPEILKFNISLKK